MATLMNRARSSSTLKSLSSLLLQTKSYAKVATGTDIISAASNVSLQKARTWDEGVASKFSTTPINDIFKVTPHFFFSLYFITIFNTLFSFLFNY
jgi:hypothetical protein